MTFDVEPMWIDAFAFKVGCAHNDLVKARQHLQSQCRPRSSENAGTLFVAATSRHTTIVDLVDAWLSQACSLLRGSTENLHRTAASYRGTDEASSARLDALVTQPSFADEGLPDVNKPRASQDLLPDVNKDFIGPVMGKPDLAKDDKPIYEDACPPHHKPKGPPSLKSRIPSSGKDSTGLEYTRSGYGRARYHTTGEAGGVMRDLYDPASEFDDISNKDVSRAFPDAKQVLSENFLDWFSPTAVVRRIYSELRGRDFLDEAAEAVAGDWVMWGRYAVYWGQLTLALEQINANLDYGRREVALYWDGRAADACDQYFTWLSGDFSVQAAACRQLREDYLELMVSIKSNVNIINDAFNAIGDAAAIGVAAGLLGLVTAPSGVGGLAAALIASAEGANIVRQVDRIVSTLGKIKTLDDLIKSNILSGPSTSASGAVNDLRSDPLKALPK